MKVGRGNSLRVYDSVIRGTNFSRVPVHDLLSPGGDTGSLGVLISLVG